jgi:hypothetical protein
MAKRDITAELEAMIDATSLQHVLTGLELICSEKADHIRSNWQDEKLAKLWDKASTVCGNAARDKRVEALP